MDWQQTVFLTLILLVIVWLLVRFVVLSRKQEEELDQARARPDTDEEIRVLLHELKNAMTLTDNVARVIQSKGFNANRFRLMLDGLDRFGEVVRIAGGRVGGKRANLREIVETSLQDMVAWPDVEVDYQGEDGEILATDMLKYALVNLFKNAVEAMQGSEVKKLYVRVETRSNRVFLVVKDTGCGIPPELHERIWEPGFTTKPDGHGTGMEVVKKGIESSDGKLIFINSEPGHGTEFVFAFRQRGGAGELPTPEN